MQGYHYRGWVVVFQVDFIKNNHNKKVVAQILSQMSSLLLSLGLHNLTTPKVSGSDVRCGKPVL